MHGKPYEKGFIGPSGEALAFSCANKRKKLFIHLATAAPKTDKLAYFNFNFIKSMRYEIAVKK
jgi:hypothetical protein